LGFCILDVVGSIFGTTGNSCMKLRFFIIARNAKIGHFRLPKVTEI
jgi:predicted dienelactone hydrolase